MPNTVDGVTSCPLEWYRRGYRACDHSRRKLWFGRKAGIGGHVCGFQAIRIGGPFLRKIQRTIDERMTVARNVGSEDSDLAVRNLACRTGVLPRHSARRLALLEKAGLVDHQHCIVIRQMLDDIVAHDIAQGISVPIPTPQNCLLPPWARIASRLRPLPTGLALLISEQTFQEQARIRRHTLLREQRTYAFLDLSKRRRPQRKRLLNRRCLRPRPPNHGCPWIQTFPKEATVMLGSVRGAPGRQPAPQHQNSVRSRRWPRGHCDHSRTADIDHITVAGSSIRIDEPCDQHTPTDANDLSTFLASRRSRRADVVLAAGAAF